MVTLSIFQLIVSTAFYMIAAQVLAKPDLGLVSTLTFLNMIFTTLAPLALPIAGTKYVSEFIGKNERTGAANVASTVIRLVATLSCVFLLGFSALAFALVTVFQWPQEVLGYVVLTLIASFLGALRLSYMGLMQGLQLFDRYAVTNVFALILSRLIGLILILFKFGLTGFAVGMVCGEAVGLVLSLVYFHGSLPKAEKPYPAKALLTFSLPLLVMNVVTALSDWIDRALFLALSQDLEALGVYELVIRGASSLAVIWAIIDVIILPVFSETYGNMGKTTLTRPLKRALRYLIFMYFPAALSLATISRTVMALLFGREYVVGHIPLAILSIFSIGTAFTIIMGSTLKAIGETRVFVKAALISLIVDSVVVAFCTPFFNLYGAVAGRVGAILVVFFYVFYELKRHIRIEFDVQSLWKGALASVALIAPLRLFEELVSAHFIDSPVLTIGIEILLGLVCYVLGLFLLKALNRDDFRLMKQLMPKALTRILTVFERLLIR
jgi:O-antigen/teichoic acid export membrane protein